MISNIGNTNSMEGANGPKLDDYFVRLVRGPPFAPGEEMKYEAVRLGSYKDWPQWAAVPAPRLAKAGFYYSGEGDDTICFSCHGHINRWDRHDDPNIEHRRNFSECELLRGIDHSNVPLVAPEEPERPMNANLEDDNNDVLGPRSLREEDALRPSIPEDLPMFREMNLSLLSNENYGIPSRMATGHTPGDFHTMVPDMQRNAGHLHGHQSMPIANHQNPFTRSDDLHQPRVSDPIGESLLDAGRGESIPTIRDVNYSNPFRVDPKKKKVPTATLR